jgi:hypothetical protein
LIAVFHSHHILPKYRGGSDDSSNIIEISVTKHAMFHYCNWRLWGNKQDWIAWKGLSQQIGFEEIFLETSSIGGKNNAGKQKSAEHRKKIANALSNLHRSELANEVKQKISSSMKGNTNSHSQKTEKSRKRHSEIMREAWKRRKEQESPLK